MNKYMVAVLGLVICGGLATTLAAEPAGPFCFSLDPLSEVFEWFFESSGGNSFTITGRDLPNRPQTAAGYLDDDKFYLGFTTYPVGSGVPVIGTATIDLNTLTGSGRCFAPDLESCGEFTIALVTCIGTP
jgi:hypothetical protein